MQKDAFAVMTEFNQSALDAAKRLGEINLRAGERLLNQQLGLANAWIETSSRQLELLGKAKAYQELLAGEAELVQGYAKQCLDGFRETTEILAEVREAVTGLVDEGTKTAAERFNQVTREAA